MALSIGTEPNYLQVSNNNIIYGLTSNSSSRDNFKVVCDIFLSGTATRIQRLKQPVNPNGVAVFDIGNVLANYVYEGTPSTSTLAFSTANTENRRFVVLFGEEYGSSSLAIFNGYQNATTGSPAFSGSSASANRSLYNNVFAGTADPNNKSNWNFVSSTKWFPSTPTPYPASTNPNFSRNVCLTNMPRSGSNSKIYIRNGEFLSISALQGNENQPSNTTSAQDIHTLRIRIFNSAGTLLSTNSFVNYTNTGGGPRAAFSAQWGTAATQTFLNASDGNKFGIITVNVGPGNLPALYTSTWDHAIIELHPQNNSFNPNTGAIWDSFVLYRQDDTCGYPGVRFAWKNVFGVYDYYTFSLQSDSNWSIEKPQAEQVFVPYNTTLATVSYSKQRKGIKHYYNEPTQTLTANTDWIDTATSLWLRELFFSPNVYYWDSSNNAWLPCIITSTEVADKTNLRTQALFQYFIEFQPSNQPNPRVAI
jgi:hypothetical protein